MRRGVRLITRRHRARDTADRANDSFFMVTPITTVPSDWTVVARADVMHAEFVSYGDDLTSTYQQYGLDADEPKPVLRLALSVHREDGRPVRLTGEHRVPPMCLSAVLASRLVVRAHPDRPGTFAVDWPRSALLTGARPSRQVDVDGTRTDLTGRVDLLIEQMRIAVPFGGIPMHHDTLDLRDVPDHVAARLRALAQRAREAPEPPVSAVPLDDLARRLLDRLPGDRPGFGMIRDRWARRGGGLAKAVLLELQGGTVFQYRGPVLEALVRIAPDDDARFDARCPLTVPINYLAVLYRTKQLVVEVRPDGQAFAVDWARTCLLAGIAPPVVVAPDGRAHDLTDRPDAVLEIMRLLVAYRHDNPGNVLDLRGLAPEQASRVLAVVHGERSPAR